MLLDLCGKRFVAVIEVYCLKYQLAETNLFIKKRFLQLDYINQKEELAKEKKILHGTSKIILVKR